MSAQAKNAGSKKKKKKEQERDGSPVHLGAGTILSRDLGWLAFNRRVLHEAADERTPLLERVRFLSIFTSNLDEFVMKRIGLLKQQIEAGITRRRLDGMTPAEQLAAVRRATQPLLADQAHIYREAIKPALEKRGIFILGYRALNAAERDEADAYFRERVFPVLTPLAVDPGHPFPFISNLSLSLGVDLRHPSRREKLFARVKIPSVLPPFIPLSSGKRKARYRFVSLVDLIAQHISELFPGMSIRNLMAFRITRNAEVERDEEEADDLLDLVSQELRQRRFERVVRLEHGVKPARKMLQFLNEELDLAPEDIYEMPALLDYTHLRTIADLPLPELRYPAWTPVPKKLLADGDADIFSVIRRRDLLVHHPYESFASSVERFVQTAAQDPQVVALKITLYRTADDSLFLPALMRAAEAGKQVVAIVELKARFDESHNIQLVQALEDAGVHVVYGMVGLKTHTKTTLVVRNEPDGLRCYAHIGTGNYHVHTAKLYTDLSLLTCRRDLTEDLVDLFHFLTGRSLHREYRKLLVAPLNIKERFLALIRREATNRKAGRPARIVAKMNTLEDPDICRALYEASAAGVPIDLIVRGSCSLRPGVKGLSETIHVLSVLGRFLEHSRIFHFAAGAAAPQAGEFYLGSADWMVRNLERRVEVVTPVEDKIARGRLWDILDTMLRDRRQAWEMRPDGSYLQRRPKPGATGPESLGTHAVLMEQARRNLHQD